MKVEEVETVSSMMGEVVITESQSGGNVSSSSAGASSVFSSGKEKDELKPEYLQALIKDQRQLNLFPQAFSHMSRLVEAEIQRVRVGMFNLPSSKPTEPLPPAEGPQVSLSEKVFVPVKEFPDYNFVGRILGPRGMTAKQLEQDTGCKVMIRGRGSMRDKTKEEANRGKPNWEHLNEGLHVLIVCEDAENRAHLQLKKCVEEIKKLLVPAPEGEDDLKRKQLMELAIMNGTYRPASAQNRNKPLVNPFNNGTVDPQRLMTPQAFGPMAAQPAGPPQLAPYMNHGPMLPSPIRLSPTRASAHHSVVQDANAYGAGAAYHPMPGPGVGLQVDPSQHFASHYQWAPVHPLPQAFAQPVVSSQGYQPFASSPNMMSTASMMGSHADASQQPGPGGDGGAPPQGYGPPPFDPMQLMSGMSAQSPHAQCYMVNIGGQG